MQKIYLDIAAKTSRGERLSLPAGQLALAFGANDLDGAMRKQKNSHAGARPDRYLSKDNLVRLIRQTGRTPVQRDSNYNVIQKY